MKKEVEKICPICKRKYSEPPSLSRLDNKDICPECGTIQALENARHFIAKDKSDQEWEEYKNEIVDAMRKGVMV